MPLSIRGETTRRSNLAIMRYPHKTATIALIVAVVSLPGFRLANSQEASNGWPKSVEAGDSGLENLWRVSERIYSGGQPEAPGAFSYLAKLGVKVVVSVDGMTPNVDAARQAGLRYVHIPIGYDSIPVAAQRQMMTVSSQVGGKIYVHCHHGKHRGPSAAAVLCMLEDQRSSDHALEILRRAGTARHYAGLWKSVSQFDRGRVQSEPAIPLVAVAKVPTTARTMVEINRHYSRLEALFENEIAKPVAVRELSMLSGELLRELSRTGGSEVEKDLLDAFRRAGGEFENLERLTHHSSPNGRMDALKKQFLKIGQNCQACHKRYRN
ncbi:MAG: hypothetical protein Aurels2KO_02740 [Aureliella sp.]